MISKCSVTLEEKNNKKKTVMRGVYLYLVYMYNYFVLDKDR